MRALQRQRSPPEERSIGPSSGILVQCLLGAGDCSGDNVQLKGRHWQRTRSRGLVSRTYAGE